MRKGHRKKFWADWEREYLREIYPKFPTSVVAEIFRRSVSSINGQAGKEGLQKSPEGRGWLRKGETSPGCERAWFPKGHIPANKGVKRPGWAPGRMRETQFRKGARSVRTGSDLGNTSPRAMFRFSTDLRCKKYRQP
jgi:hypothetical protein